MAKRTDKQVGNIVGVNGRAVPVYFSTDKVKFYVRSRVVGYMEDASFQALKDAINEAIQKTEVSANGDV